jgi:hypothetical protein
VLDQGEEPEGARDAADCRGRMVMPSRATLVPDQPADAIQALAKTEKKAQGDFITQSKTGRGLENIKKTDIQQASWMDDVHKAASYLQDIAGIGPSHVADQYLDQTKWRDTTARITLLQEWLTAEALHYER